jgi:GMP synthase (glutamine-hydrolysing)
MMMTKPILGICFGHQIIAETFGGEIANKKPRELGTVEVYLTPKVDKDTMFRGFHSAFSALMSHQDIVSKTSDSIVTLAHNPFCHHQAIAVGECIRGIQFHPESTKEKILRLTDRWYKEFKAERLNMAELKKHLRDTPAMKKSHYNSYLQ